MLSEWVRKDQSRSAMKVTVTIDRYKKYATAVKVRSTIHVMKVNGNNGEEWLIVDPILTTDRDRSFHCWSLTKKEKRDFSFEDIEQTILFDLRRKIFWLKWFDVFQMNHLNKKIEGKQREENDVVGRAYLICSFPSSSNRIEEKRREVIDRTLINSVWFIRSLIKEKRDEQKKEFFSLPSDASWFSPKSRCCSSSISIDSLSSEWYQCWQSCCSNWNNNEHNEHDNDDDTTRSTNDDSFVQSNCVRILVFYQCESD